MSNVTFVIKWRDVKIQGIVVIFIDKEKLKVFGLFHKKITWRDFIKFSIPLIA